jgi:hypothetical protein
MVDLSNFLSEAERLPPQVQEWLNSGIMKPKNFWAMNGSRWPSIKPLATKIFALVTSTTSSERSWSTQGYIHSKIRNCLGNEKVNKLVFVKSNSQLLDPPPLKASREGSGVSGDAIPQTMSQAPILIVDSSDESSSDESSSSDDESLSGKVVQAEGEEVIMV